MDNFPERRSRTLTDADIVAIVLALQKEQSCACPFTSDEVSGIRALLIMMDETKSTVIKSVVAALIATILAIMLLGAKVWVKQ